ncbi:MAG: hypothetical protein KHY19_02500 [Coprobacillus cateniformis]|nr:hypothetical protein [Coprobacillus cateniformis]
MAIDFFEMMKEEQKKASKQQTPKQEQQPKKEEKVADNVEGVAKTDEVFEKVKKKEEKLADNAKKETKSKASAEEYEYPFSLYTEGHTVDISEYCFEDGKKYTPKQINDIMLKHRHYEFAGEMTYKMFEDDNMLVATAKQYKKG